MKRFWFTLIALFGVSFIGTAIVYQSADAAETKGGPMVQVAPVIEELTLNPASSIDKTISVTNQSTQELKVRVYVTPYSFSTESNSSDFESQTEYIQIYHWIKFMGANLTALDEAEFTIGAQKTIDIKYQVRVPDSAPGGSQHACIFVETVPEETAEANSIVTVSRTAIKIFANVSGETISDAEVLGLNTDTFIIGGNVKAVATVKNIGNVDIKPALTLKVTNFGGETLFDNSDVAMIFPENSDKLEVEWPDTPSFGIYNLSASIKILGKDQIIQKTIFILPSWFIVLLLIVIIAIVVAVIRFYSVNKGKKQRKKHTA